MGSKKHNFAVCRCGVGCAYGVCKVHHALCTAFRLWNGQRGLSAGPLPCSAVHAQFGCMLMAWRGFHLEGGCFCQLGGAVGVQSKPK